ncbi:3'-5' exonuclease [Zunongwangia endophytica]|uniref:PolC-type DNA polymerase III n=1 Tax=Zunongwangia endophytica TaxID=1808945 RepID=A0ABV8HE71_9FLAO|nr:3'-5' exonuclease [Zunongwangia endophytica]MDN3594625.1 3'-5' exonuclease [Zunongwangia endophytica]
MINWFKKDESDLPEFWQKYSAKFNIDQKEQLITDTTFVVLDTETTGFDQEKDRILSIGCVKVHNNKLLVSNSFEVYLKQEAFNPDTVEIHGLIKHERFDTFTEEKALQLLLKYLGNSVLVAHHAGFDVNMLNAALKRNQLPKLKNRVLDTGVLYRKTRIISNFIDQHKNYSLDEIALAYNIDLKDRHTAIGDAFITAIAFLKILGRLKRKKLKELLKM